MACRAASCSRGSAAFKASPPHRADGRTTWVFARAVQVAYGVAVHGGDVIREARTAAGWTQARLAEAGGTTQSAIARWERGATEPAFDTVVRLVEACGYGAELTLRPRGTSSLSTAKSKATAATKSSSKSNATRSAASVAAGNRQGGATDISKGAGHSAAQERPDLPAIPGLDLISDVLDLLRTRGRRRN